MSKDYRVVLAALLLSLGLSGCAARKDKLKVPTWIPCGAEVEFVTKCSDGYWNPEIKVCQNVPYCPKTGCAPEPAKGDGHKEVWVFPCWPEKNEPKCIKGCK